MREQILALLERNSKMTPEEIAVLLGSSKEMIAEEIRRMEEENIICGYNTLINWEHTGAEKVTGLIEVRVTPQRGQGFDHIAERIYNYPEVQSVYLISGGYDLLVYAFIASFPEGYFGTLSYIGGVVGTTRQGTHRILKRLVADGIVKKTKTTENGRVNVVYMCEPRVNGALTERIIIYIIIKIKKKKK